MKKSIWRSRHFWRGVSSVMSAFNTFILLMGAFAAIGVYLHIFYTQH